MLNLGGVFFSVQADARKLRAVSGVMKKFGQDAEQQQGKLGKFTKTMRDLESASVLAVGPLSGIGARIRALGSIAGRSTLKIVAFLAGITAMSVALFKLSRLAIDSRKEFEKINSALVIATGNSDSAALEFKFIAETSQRMGLDLKAAGAEYAKMAVATSRAGISAEDTRIIFEGLSAASSSLKLEAEATSGAFRAFNQIASKGKVQAEELVGQLAERLPGALQLAAEGLGVTTVKLLDMVRKGQVLAKDFLPALGRELKRAFGEAGVRAGKELQGTLNNLSNSMFLFGKALDDVTGISETYRSAVASIASTVNFLTVNMDRLISVIGAAAGAMVTFFAPQIIAGLSTLITLFATLTKGVRAFTVALLANPLGGFISILLKVGAVLIGAAAGFALFTDSLNAAGKATRAMIKNNQAFLDSINIVTKATVQAAKDRVKAVEQEIIAIRARIKALQIQEGLDLTLTLGIRPGELAAGRQAAKLEQELAKLDKILGKLRGFALTKPLTFDVSGLSTKDKGLAKFIREMERSLKTLDKFDLRLAEVNEQTKALAAGPDAFKQFDKLQKRSKIIEAARLQLEGTKLTVEEIKERMDRFTEAMDRNFEAQEKFDRLKQIADDIKGAFETGFENVGRSITDAFVKGEKDAIKFQDVVLGVISEIVQALLRAALIKPLTNLLGGFLGNLFGGAPGASDAASNAIPGAKGLVMAAGSVTKMGKGGVLSAPTFFPGANAIGGEAGDEGLLPLKRNARGELGVISSGAANVVVLVNVINNSNASVTTGQRQAANGSTELTVLIDKSVAGSIKNGGETFRSIRDVFGITQSTTGR